MIRYACFEWLAPLLTDQLVVTSLSGQRVEWGHLSKRDADLNLGSMGNALAVGIGLALALPHRKVLVFESDGSVLLSLFNLPTLANLNPHNLAVFVFDNQAYSGTRISYPSATAGKTDLAAVARGSGVDQVVTVSELEEFKREATMALNQAALHFVVCKIEESLGHRTLTRSNVDLLETKYRFVRYLERTEGKAIFPRPRVNSTTAVEIL
jgi:thiamine pyrophosphate-dependent acetolactate synthase large subunit-like protein